MLFNSGMADKDLSDEQLAEVQAIRHKNFKKLLTHYGTNVVAAEKLGLSVGHVSQLKNGTRKMGDGVARRIEGRLMLPNEAMDRKLDIHGDVRLRIEAVEVAHDWLQLGVHDRGAVRDYLTKRMTLAKEERAREQGTAPANGTEEESETSDVPLVVSHSRGAAHVVRGVRTRRSA